MSVDIVVDMQLGSSGKGKFCQYLARKNKYELYDKGGGINSGHTIYVGNQKVKLQILPVGTFVDKNALLLLDPSTTITPEVLKKECKLAESLGYSVKGRLYLDPNVGFITKSHIKEEIKLTNKIGSVGTGTGPARISRLKRDGSLPIVEELIVAKNEFFQSFLEEWNIKIVKSYELMNHKFSLIEGYQATHLDVLHSKFYPFCTSWGTTASALAWNAGVAPSDVRNVYGVFCPIMTRPGTASGNTYNDSTEISWETIKNICGADVDLTEIAVTSGRIRRAFTFSKQMFQESVILNKPTHYALIRGDYIDWTLKEKKIVTQKLIVWTIDNLNSLGLTIDHIDYVSYGPKEDEYLIP